MFLSRCSMSMFTCMGMPGVEGQGVARTVFATGIVGGDRRRDLHVGAGLLGKGHDVVTGTLEFGGGIVILIHLADHVNHGDVAFLDGDGKGEDVGAGDNFADAFDQGLGGGLQIGGHVFILIDSGSDRGFHGAGGIRIGKHEMDLQQSACGECGAGRGLGCLGRKWAGAHPVSQMNGLVVGGDGQGEAVNLVDLGGELRDLIRGHSHQGGHGHGLLVGIGRGGAEFLEVNAQDGEIAGIFFVIGAEEIVGERGETGVGGAVAAKKITGGAAQDVAGHRDRVGGTGDGGSTAIYAMR